MARCSNLLKASRMMYTLWFSSFERWSIGLNLIVLLFLHKSVNAALDLVEAGPAAGPFGFAIGGLPRAWPAPDRAIPAVLERVVGNLTFVNVAPDLVAAPIRHW